MRTKQRNRRGFTLVEMLIVIVIILILAGLAFRAISSAFRKANEARAANELSSLNTALESFRSKYGVYPPSRLRLRENTAYDVNDPFDQHSVRYLRRIWPNIILPTGVANGATILWCKDNPNKTELTVANSSGGGAGTPGNTQGTVYELEGDECLVFFLGGVAEFDRSNARSPITLHGFSARPTNPGGVPDSTAPQTLTREGPLHEFEAARLFIRRGAAQIADPPTSAQEVGEFQNSNGTIYNGYFANNAAQAAKLPSLRDILGEPEEGRPLAYFSAYEGQGYRPHDVNMPQTAGSQWNEPTPAFAYQLTYLPPTGSPAYFRLGISSAPNPYTESAPNPNRPTESDPEVTGPSVVRFHKRDGYQLIAAGRDNLYGPGGQIARDRTSYGGDLETTGPSFDNFTSVSGSSALGDYNAQAKQ